MEKKCAKCGEVKNIKEFRAMRAERKYCSYCKKCEVIYTQERRAKNRKTTLKVQIKKNWTELCASMDITELDCELYNLKKIWEEVQHNAK